MSTKDKKKVSRKKKDEPSRKGKIGEEKMLKIIKAKEQRDMDVFYKLGDTEPEEEPIEQKIRRNKKEISDNTKR